MATKSLTFDIYGRDKSASKTIRKVGDEAENAGKTFKRMGLVATAGLAIAAAAVVKFGTDSVKAYAEAEESQNKLAFAYEKFPALADTNIDAMRRLNTELAKKTRYDDDAYAVGQAQLAQYGLTGEQIMELTPLLADYAGKTGKELPTAAEDLGKALLGQGRALKDVGIDFTDTGTLAGNFDQIMQGLRGQVGGFAEQDATTAAGKLDILKNKFGEVQESVGEKLIGPLSDVMDELTESGAVEDLGTALGDVVQGFADLEKKTGFLSDFADDMSQVGNMVDQLEAVGDWFAQGSLFDPEALAKVWRDLTSGEGGWEKGEKGLLGFLPTPEESAQYWRDNKTITVEGVEGVRHGMGGGFSAMRGDMSVFGTDLNSRLSSTWSEADGRTRAGWGNIERSTGAGVGKVGSKVREIPGVVKSPFGDAGSWLADAGGDIVEGLIDGIKRMIGDAARTAANLAAATVKAAKDALGIQSPSTVFREIGMNMGAGMDEGIEAAMAKSHSTIEALVSVPAAATAAPSSASERPIYADGIGLIGFIRELANGEARLVFAMGEGGNVMTSKMGKQR